MARPYALAALLLFGCRHAAPAAAVTSTAKLSKVQRQVLDGARDQLTWGTGYTGEYFTISYPGGDPPRTKGACTDVVVRAYRNAGIDLQKLIHEDISKNWSKYPRYASSKKPDSNIDHRRVPNQQVFFKRFWKSFKAEAGSASDWEPGDVVTWKIVGGKDHTGVCTDKLDSDGFPFVIHNIGGGPAEEDVLRTWSWSITGHYRYPNKR